MNKYYQVTKKSTELLFTEEVQVEYDEVKGRINIVSLDGKTLLTLNKLSFVKCIVLQGDFFNPNNNVAYAKCYS